MGLEPTTDAMLLCHNCLYEERDRNQLQWLLHFTKIHHRETPNTSKYTEGPDKVECHNSLCVKKDVSNNNGNALRVKCQ